MEETGKREMNRKMILEGGSVPIHKRELTTGIDIELGKEPTAEAVERKGHRLLAES